MKYLVRTLIMLVFIPGVTILVFGFLLSIILSLLQILVWFVWKGELIEDDETWLAWYIENVLGPAGDLWERIMKHVK